MLKVFDLFSGCGGFRLGLERAGCKFVGYCEIDKWAALLYKNYFNTKNEVYFNDATKIDTAELPNFDILCAGFPCQSFSIAGKRKGFNDTRGTLFFDVARILKDKRPRYFILENVKGLLNHDHGQTFITIIKTLTDLGYNVEWSVLNSKYFGVPQNRERVFIVGYLGKRCAGQIFPIIRTDSENCIADKTEKIIYWKNSKEKWVEEDRNNVGTIKTQSDLCRQPLLKVDVIGNVNPSQKGQNGNVYNQDGISPTLTTNKGEGIKIGTLRTHKVDGGFRETADNMCPTIPARAREDGSGQPVIMQLGRGHNKGGLKEDCPTITKNQWEYNNLLVQSTNSNGYEVAENGDSINIAFPGSKTRRGRIGKQCSQTVDTEPTIATYYEGVIRRLTPTECFRLQGFPDDIIEKARQLKISDAQLYKMAGNSVTTNVVYEVAKRLTNASIG